MVKQKSSAVWDAVSQSMAGTGHRSSTLPWNGRMLGCRSQLGQRAGSAKRKNPPNALSESRGACDVSADERIPRADRRSNCCSAPAPIPSKSIYAMDWGVLAD